MMLQTTTPIVEGHPIKEYKGIVSAQSIIGANVLKDFMAGMRDFLVAVPRLMKKFIVRPRRTLCVSWPKRL